MRPGARPPATRWRKDGYGEFEGQGTPVRGPGNPRCRARGRNLEVVGKRSWSDRRHPSSRPVTGSEATWPPAARWSRDPRCRLRRPPPGASFGAIGADRWL